MFFNIYKIWALKELYVISEKVGSRPMYPNGRFKVECFFFFSFCNFYAIKSRAF